MKKTLLIILINTLIIGCLVNKQNTRIYYTYNKDKDSIKIVKFEEAKIDTVPYLENVLFFKKTSDNKYIIYLLRTKTDLIFYNLANKNKDTIKLPKEVSDFYYLNEDSIFILNNVVHDFGYHDSAFFLINKKGEIKKIYNFDDAPVLTHNNYLNRNKDSSCIVFSNEYEPLNIYKQKIFLHLQSNASYLGQAEYANMPIIGYMDLKENKFHALNITYPDIKFGKEFYPYDFVFFNSVIDNKGNLILSFPYTPKLVIYNIDSGKISYKTLKSKIFDTIFPAHSVDEIDKDWQFHRPMYMAVFYDRYRNYYYRLVRLPREYKKARYLMIVADSNFNYIGEGLVPLKYIPTLYFNDKYFYAFKLSDDEKQLLIYSTEMSLENSTNQKFLRELSKYKEKGHTKEKTDKAEYFKELTGQKKKNYTMTIIFYDNMCESMRDFIFKHYAANEKEYNEYNTYLMLVTSNDTKKIKNLLSDYGLSPDDHKNIIIDSTMKFVKYNDFTTDYYPRVIKVRKKKVVLDSLFTTQYSIGETWQDVLIEATKEQKK